MLRSRLGAVVGAVLRPLGRRRFLRWSLGAGLGLAGWGWLGPGRTSREGQAELPAWDPASRCFSPAQLATLQAVALRILDGAEPPPSRDGAAAQCRFIDRYVAGLAAPIRTDLRAGLVLVEHAPLLRYGARFTRLTAADQDAVLQGFSDSRVTTLRQVFVALKSLCCLSHYQDEQSFAAIGYSGPLVRR